MDTIPTQSLDPIAPAPTGHYHTGKRLRKLHRPDGKRIHIAASPEEHLRLTRSLPNIEPDDNFEVHIHGSAEHVSRLGQFAIKILLTEPSLRQSGSSMHIMNNAALNCAPSMEAPTKNSRTSKIASTVSLTNYII